MEENNARGVIRLVTIWNISCLLLKIALFNNVQCKFVSFKLGHSAALYQQHSFPVKSLALKTFKLSKVEARYVQIEIVLQKAEKSWRIVLLMRVNLPLLRNYGHFLPHYVDVTAVFPRNSLYRVSV